MGLMENTKKFLREAAVGRRPELDPMGRLKSLKMEGAADPVTGREFSQTEKSRSSRMEAAVGPREESGLRAKLKSLKTEDAAGQEDIMAHMMNTMRSQRMAAADPREGEELDPTERLRSLRMEAVVDPGEDTVQALMASMRRFLMMGAAGQGEEDTTQQTPMASMRRSLRMGAAELEKAGPIEEKTSTLKCLLTAAAEHHPASTRSTPGTVSLKSQPMDAADPTGNPRKDLLPK
jgi:hypothetical protein